MINRAGQSHGSDTVLPSTERPQDYGVPLKRDGGHMSDEEGGSYDDEMLRHRRPDMKRESV